MAIDGTVGTVTIGILGVVAGAMIAWPWARSELIGFRRLADQLTQERDASRVAAAQAGAAAEQLRLELNAAQSARDRAETLLEAERTQTQEKLTLLKEAREELSAQFRNVATDLLDEKTKKLGEVNDLALSTLLTPLQAELKGFRQKVEEVYIDEAKERSALREQVRLLSDVNGTLRSETLNLTNALRGESKTQGDWGEVILGRLLESAGLIEGEHYKTQVSQVDSDGVRVIPDVVLLLPNDRQIVVDSKVTLTAYSSLTAATTDGEREEALRAHVDSVRRHIKGLTEKKYQDLYQISGLDCVVMFMPIEGAFSAALIKDRDLFQFGWERNVLLVSPSTFLFVIRTIAHVWRQEAQTRNAVEIASRGAALYDKFVSFVVDLTKVGDSLEKANDSYSAARKKLSEGSGNLVRQVEMLRKLGVKPSKHLPNDVIGETDEVDSDETPSRLPGATESGSSS